MKDRSRILVCRVGFVALCVLPTIAVGGWILMGAASGFSSASKSEWELLLTERLGLIAKIDRVDYLPTGRAELTGLRLLDPETQQAVAEAGRVEIGAAADGWQVSAAQVFVEEGQLQLLSRVVNRRFLEGPHATLSDKDLTCVHFAPCSVLVRGVGWEQTLEQFGGEVRASAKQTAIELRWQLPGAVSELDAVRFAVVRDRAVSPPATKYQLNTGRGAVPMRLAAAIVPKLAGLGRDCQLSGVVELQRWAGGLSGQMKGRLSRVDLDSLITERFGHRLSGVATIEIELGLVEDGKLTELRGKIEAKGGAISRSLLAAAAEHLELKAADAWSDVGSTTQAFRRLAIDFQITGSSLALRGTADSKQDGSLLTNEAGPILSAAPKHTVAAVNLLRTLLPESQFQVPASRQTGALVQWLPLPDVPASNTAILPAHTPTRLAPATAQTLQNTVKQPVLR